MRITFKLFASLTDFLPLAVRPGNEMALDVASTDTIDQIIAPFRMPPQLTHLVLVNGRYIPPAERASTTLHEGDTLAIWPPIAGG